MGIDTASDVSNVDTVGGACCGDTTTGNSGQQADVTDYHLSDGLRY